MDKMDQLHVLAMVPQIFLITCAEILCSITVLEFAYAYVSSVVLQFRFGNDCGDESEYLQLASDRKYKILKAINIADNRRDFIVNPII